VRFNSIEISNFRAVRSFEVHDLEDMVVIAGPNGCGKSAVLDALRLLKSVYGGYQRDEWRSWFGEFQINFNRPGELGRLLRDRDRPLRIAATVGLAESERQYLRDNAEAIVEPFVWREVVGVDFDRASYGDPALATELRVHGATVRARASERAAEIRAAMTESAYPLEFTIGADMQLRVTSCKPMEVVFQTYDPLHLGIIDYHSASRNYQREALGGLNLNLDSVQQQRRDQSLYNWEAKYRNVKAELAAHYVRELISARAGGAEDSRFEDLNQTLKELFQTFFPDKEYEGPRATVEGTLDFPVRLRTGQVHDIDDLSSGEKEVLYGYLRVRNSAPNNSVILIDEPELHLNPGLLQGFPDFYHRHLGRNLGNQLVLVTHSDALLRQSVGNASFSVFHMRSATVVPSEGNQAIQVTADTELERAVIDLVGDLATYKPQAKVVILEGGGETDFDVQMVSRLFPSFAASVNLLSGGSKRRVRDLYAILSDAASKAAIAQDFFAIVDQDSGMDPPTDEASVYAWDRYHIESYLLEPKFVLAALGAIAPQSTLDSEQAVRSALRACAGVLVSRLVLERVQREANQALIGVVDIGAPRDAADAAAAIRPSIEGSTKRFDLAAKELLRAGELESRAASHQASLENALKHQRWQKESRGD
jgi:energy-coupling factor transporter ATP-binding protein EcfA2